MDKNNRTEEEKFREYVLKTQFNIPARLNYLAEQYPNVTWYEAQKLYEDVVDDILTTFDVECILDVDEVGRGFHAAKVGFINELHKLSKRKAETNESNHKKRVKRFGFQNTKCTRI